MLSSSSSPFTSQTPLTSTPIFDAPTPTATLTPLQRFLVEVIHTENSEDNLKRWSSFIGICIAIAGNILISLALNVQKYAHTRLERQASQNGAGNLRAIPSGVQDGAVGDEEANECRATGSQNGTSSADERSMLFPSGREKNEGGDSSYIASPYWWAGLIMMFFGECGNFLAYGFAASSIVAPLGVVAMISNCVVAPVMLKEPFRGRDAMGVAVSVIGAIMVVWSAEKEEVKLGPDEILEAISQTAFKVYFGITCTIIIFLINLSNKHGHRTIFLDLSLVALIGGYTVLSTKGISSLISSSFYHIFQYPIAYLFTIVLISTAILQVKYLNRALARFDSTQVIPTQFVLFTISVIVGSAILYGDFNSVTAERMLKFTLGCSLTFIGVYFISSKRSKTRHQLQLDDGNISPSPEPRSPVSSRPLLARADSTAEESASSVTSGTPLSRLPSDSLGMVPGVTAYQLGGAIRNSGTFPRRRVDSIEQSGEEGRRGSLGGLVLDFVTGKRKEDDEPPSLELPL